MKKRFWLLPVILLCAAALALSACSGGGEESEAESGQGSQSGEISDGGGAADAVSELLNCQENVGRADSFSSETSGVCNIQILFFSYPEQILSSRILTKDASFSEDVRVGTLTHSGLQQFFSGDAILVRRGDALSAAEVAWNDHPVAVSDAAFSDAYGALPDRLSPFLLKKETIISAGLLSESEDGFTFYYELDPVGSTADYAKRLRTLGGLEKAPAFQSVRMTLTMNRERLPVSVRYEETYTIEFPLLGSVTCKADYTETFGGFGTVGSIPSESAFLPYLKEDAQSSYPASTGGYSAFSLLFGHDAAFDLHVGTADTEIEGFLAVNPAMKTIWLQGANANIIYADERYYLDVGSNRLFVEKNAFDSAIKPIEDISGVMSGLPIEELLSGLKMSAADGAMVLTASIEGGSVRVELDSSSMTLKSLRLAYDAGGTKLDLLMEKSARTVELPTLTDYRDATEALPALQFFEGAGSGKNLGYRLEVSGGMSFAAEIRMRLGETLDFSVRSLNEAFPVTASLVGDSLVAEWEGLSVTGSSGQLRTLLSIWGSSPSGTEREPFDLSGIVLKTSPGCLTADWEGRRFVLEPNRLTVTGGSSEWTAVKAGTTDDPIIALKPASQNLKLSSLIAFSSDSVYPALLHAGTVEGALLLQQDGSVYEGTVCILPSEPFGAGMTLRVGQTDVGLVLSDDALFLTAGQIRSCVDSARLSSFFELVSGLFSDGTGGKDGGIVLHGCDAGALNFSVGGITVNVSNEGILLLSDGVSLSFSGFSGKAERSSIMAPDRADCMDLYELAVCLSGIKEQKDFAFTGSLTSDGFSATVGRLECSLAEDLTPERIVLELFSPGKPEKKLFLREDGLYYDNGSCKLFIDKAAAESVLDGAGGGFSPGSFSLDGLREVSLRDGVLTVVTEAYSVRLTFTDERLSGLLFSEPDLTVDLRAALLAPAADPVRSEYRDVSALGSLFSAAKLTYDLSGFSAQAKMNVRIGSYELTDVNVSGLFSFAGDGSGYLGFDVPYIEGVTSADIPSSDALRILSECTIRSELYLKDEKLYFHKVIKATYGLLFSKTVTITKDAWLSVSEAAENPMKALCFALNLSEGEADDSGSGSFPWEILKDVRCGDSFLFTLNPALISDLAQKLTVEVRTGARYVESVELNASLSAFSVQIKAVLGQFGTADPSPYLRKDFSGYFHMD